MRKLIYLCLALSAAAVSCKKEKTTPVVDNPQPKYDSTSIFSYSFTDIDGKEMKLSDMKGKKIMFVNTASYCSNTPQYEGLENLYVKYKDKLTIIGFPCNDFGQQEPGDKDDIKGFCASYNVTFPLSEKIEILSNTHPIYRWLTQKRLNGKFDSSVAWNFQKYLVDADGSLVAMFENQTDPEDPTIIKEIEK
jgi:glutathione peroxidase